MKFFQFIKITLLILLLSSNLMLGQKRAGRMTDAKIDKCVEVNQTEKIPMIKLSVLPANVKSGLDPDCSARNSTYLGSFFQFAAF
jgi:hypothetical protein